MNTPPIIPATAVAPPPAAGRDHYYAGPFCNCGDYSCPASEDTDADCVHCEPAPIYDTWCRCGINGCAAHHSDEPCSYPPEHPIHA